MSTPDSRSAAQKFAVLKAGTANRQARERLGDFSGMFVSLLSRPGQQWDVHDVEHGEFPPDLRAYDGFAITGSPASVYDDQPWIHRLLAVIREIQQRRIPLLGICFGHQAVAQALGGTVQPNPKGWEVGVRALALTGAGASLAGFSAAPHPLALLELHGDVVTRLPPGAVPLAGSDRTQFEMYAVGDRTLCLQGHPEFDADVVREAIDKLEARGRLTPDQAAAARATLATPVPGGFWRPWLQEFLVRGGLRTISAPAVSAVPAAKR
jgi:GMP synthase (glutamine-hydrolysing)